MMKKIVILLLLILLVLPITSFALPVLDQLSPLGPGAYYKANVLTWEQSVTAGMGGLLSQIDIYFFTNESVNFKLFAGPPWQVDFPEFDITFNPVENAWNNIDVSSANFFVSVGDTFTLMLHGSDPNTPLFGGSNDPGLYPEGELWLNGNLYLGVGERDMAFRTYVDSQQTQVPEPSTMLFLGSGLIGLAGYGRKKFFKK
jgi:hypothetical protein